MKENKLFFVVMMFAGMIWSMGSSASALEVAFTDDFSAWSLVAWSNPAGNEPGDWLAASNSDSLSWNLTVTAGAANRGKYYTYTAAHPITKIEFDWRFSNDQFYDRLVFELLDEADNVIWTATSTAGAQAKPLNHAVITTNTSTITFSYRQKPDTIFGKPAFFDSSNQDDWDAYIDNVTLTLDLGCTQVLAGDINKDCVVDLNDLILLVNDWMLCDNPDPDLCP